MIEVEKLLQQLAEVRASELDRKLNFDLRKTK